MLNLVKKYVLCCVLLLLSPLVYGQESTLIEQAARLKDEGKLREASGLIEEWLSIHGPDADVLWLHAQISFWRKRFKQSELLYEKALELQPENLYLKLDYIETLLNMGRMNKADKLINSLTNKEATDPYAMYLMAKWHYWSGHLKTGQELADKATKSKSVHAPALLKEIKKIRSPVVSIGSVYSTDTQPLDRINTIANAGFAHSNLLNMQINMEYGKVLNSELPATTKGIEIQNKFRISKTGTDLTLSGGLFKLSDFDHSAMYGLAITQRLPDNIQLELSGRHLPYLYTRASLDTTVFVDLLKISAHWMERHGFELNTGWQKDIFQDQNVVNTGWIWMLSPALRLKNLTGKLGYAFSFSDTEISMFNAQLTLEQILARPDPLAQIEGIYTPYFTPKSMHIHSVLLSLEVPLGKKIHLTLKGDYGFYAHAMNPYLFLNSEPGSTIFLDRGFERTLFNPFRSEGKIDWDLSDRLGISVAYLYQRIFFYDIQTAMIHLNYYF